MNTYIATIDVSCKGKTTIELKIKAKDYQDAYRQAEAAHKADGYPCACIDIKEVC